MKYSSLYVGAVAIAAVVGFAAPAAALPANWTGPYQVDTGGLDCTGTGAGTACPVPNKTHIHLLNSAFGADKEVGYAGPLTISIGLNPVPPNLATNLIVFCDDLAKTIDINHTYHNFYASDPAAPQEVVNYLNTSLSVAHQIMGLTARGTYDAIHGLLTPELGAAFQMAIWELEYGGSATFSADAGFQTVIDQLIGNAASDYAFFTNSAIWLVPWTFTQLESPCNVNNVGLVTKDPPQDLGPVGDRNPNCQNEQGLIAALPGIRRENVPEPITLSLFGAGIAGVAAYRRRRKSKA